MMRTIRKRWYLLIAVIAVAAIINFQRASVSGEKAEKPETFRVRRDTLEEKLVLSGEIDAYERAILKFQTSGRLAWVGVKEGDPVKKFQTIASLDQRDLKNRMTKYLNTYAKQRNTFDETKSDDWNQQYALSQSLRDEAKRLLENNQFDLDNSVLDVEYQKLSMEYANLYSPIDGVVTRIDTPFAGVNVTPAGSEIEIVNPSTLYLSVTAEQSDVVLLRQGMTGEMVFDAYPDSAYTGTIGFISFSPKKGESGTVYQVKLDLDNTASSLPLKLAMTGDVTFVIGEKPDVLSVPLKFLKKDPAKGDYLIVGKNGKVEKSFIEKGDQYDEMVEVKKGIGVGDVVYSDFP